MAESSSIINFGDLSKPVNTLVEKIAEAVSVRYEPTQIRKKARAEADAEKIRALGQIEVEKIRMAGQIEITEIQQRAVHRMLAEETKKQENMESIIEKALPQVNDQAETEKVENDWLSHFFDKSRLVSDEEMQELWAKVLAGQANAPGKYTKRTLDILGNLEKEDAILFSKLADFNSLGIDPIVLVYDFEHEIYKNNGINFMVLSHLESLGLIHFDSLSGYIRQGLEKNVSLNYDRQEIQIEFSEDKNNQMQFGHVIYTKAGKELVSICSTKPVSGFISYLEDHWTKLGYKITLVNNFRSVKIQ